MCILHLRQDWSQVVETLTQMLENETALLMRQIELRNWYTTYMHAKITEIEDELMAKVNQTG
eukprot:m.90895 g.90895  ORF g.90895 m.90895 type:complete len:62 (+) comp16479_c0_seq1:486-671(+)